MAQPDSKKIFFENLSGAGKAIAVLTSGGDAQGKGSVFLNAKCVSTITRQMRNLVRCAGVPAGRRRQVGAHEKLRANVTPPTAPSP